MRFSTSAKSPGGQAVSGIAAPSFRCPTPNTTCSCRWRSRARRHIANWTFGWMTTSAPIAPTPRLPPGRADGAAMETYDIAIIGTGSGNSILDDRFANKRAAICEQGTFGGTCLNVGGIPTKMFVYAAEVANTIRDAARYGVDAHIDRVRWDDIVSRIFGRIDPIALTGEDYRRAAPNIDVYSQHTRFGPVQPDGRYLLRTDAGEEFTADQVVSAAGVRGVLPP